MNKDRIINVRGNKNDYSADQRKPMGTYLQSYHYLSSLQKNCFSAALVIRLSFLCFCFLEYFVIYGVYRQKLRFK